MLMVICYAGILSDRSLTDAHLEENTFHCWKVQMEEAGDDMMKDVNMVGSSEVVSMCR